MSCPEEVPSAECSAECKCGGLCSSASESWQQEKTGQKKRENLAESEAAGYLEEHLLPELFAFLMGHLLTARPDNPIEYLYDLLDKCLLFRAGLIEPPLLFAPRHIESMYKSLDPENLGCISMKQYVTGMKSLGITCFNPSPMLCRCNPDLVDQGTFQMEAKRCLVRALKKMIAKPRICHSESSLVATEERYCNVRVKAFESPRAESSAAEFCN